ncbi:hypothetical protein PSPO01_09895 [Paraphaeosphaeria sporulosa]
MCWPKIIDPHTQHMHAQGKRATASPPNNAAAPRQTWFTQNMLHGSFGAWPARTLHARPSPSPPKSGLRPGDHPRLASSQAPSKLHPFCTAPFRCCDLPPQATPPPVLCYRYTAAGRRESHCLAIVSSTDRLIGTKLEKTDTHNSEGLQRRSPTLLHFDRRRVGERWQLGYGWTSCCPNRKTHPPCDSAGKHHRRMRPA